MKSITLNSKKLLGFRIVEDISVAATSAKLGAKFGAKIGAKVGTKFIRA